MRKKSPSNGNNNTYSKEQARHLKRIRSFIKSAEKRGYYFYDRKVPKSKKMKEGFGEFKIPKPVKNPTAVTVARLEKITKEYLYERALWVDPETGDVHSAKEGRTIERSRAAQKGAETRRKNKIPAPEVNHNLAIIDTIRGYIEALQIVSTGRPSLTPYKNMLGNYLLTMFDELVEYEEDMGDIYAYAAYLELNASALNNLIDEAIRGSAQETVDFNVTAFMTIINRGVLTQEQRDDISEYTEAMGYGGGYF